MNYRERARQELEQWSREVLGRAIREDIDRMIALGMTEEQAKAVVHRALLDSTRGLRGDTQEAAP